MRKLFYCSIEKYEARYSHQLTQWNESVFNRRQIDYFIVDGQSIPKINSNQINVGSVLDANGRPYYCLTQVAKLIELISHGEITHEDVIFFDDASTYGIEALAFALDQIDKSKRPRIFIRMLAGVGDQDDFVWRENMVRWMRHFEMMMNNFVDGIIVASEEMVSHLRLVGYTCPIYVSGLPFGKAEVQSRISNVKPLQDRSTRVAFAARWDAEKQPRWFMEIVQKYFKIDPSIEFAVLSGNSTLKSNNIDFVNEAYELQDSPNANFKIYTGLKKNEYYEILSDSQVLFNCALQDWVSNTVSEALSFGTLPLYPAYRSFPETLFNDERVLYVPWSQDDAISKLTNLLYQIRINNTHSFDNLQRIVDWQNGTIDRTLDIFQGNGEQWRRDAVDYRLHVNKNRLSYNGL
jgi:glycosyltransferase involved in cell wall biosynthesis